MFQIRLDKPARLIIILLFGFDSDSVFVFVFVKLNKNINMRWQCCLSVPLNDRKPVTPWNHYIAKPPLFFTQERQKETSQLERGLVNARDELLTARRQVTCCQAL